ncbi:MAG: aminomethyl-transferring glycine dehydrogenase subunit GcvPB [Christensenellales bacterium]|jgi:glycine dehydrogenase subunit 2
MKLIFEKSSEGRRCSLLPRLDVAEYKLGGRALNLPEISEVDLVRHYTALSKRAYGVDDGFYPLGSCTMKYNPKVNEDAAKLSGFTKIHPLQPEDTVQGALQVIYMLSGALKEISGMDAVSLQPAAGAQGEYAGLLVIKKYLESIGQSVRDKIIVPDSAHGTNPATANSLGFKIINIPSDERKMVDIDALKAAVGEDTAALMLTNPNTLGLFDSGIEEIVKIVHDAGGLLYYDGANLNAVMGISRPGDMGFDVMHFNLHKTFSTPHGGGGPGAGPIGCKEFLREFLPEPAVIKEGGRYRMVNPARSVGKIKAFYGNFNVCVKALAYIMTLGREGLKKTSEIAVLNANYMLKSLSDTISNDYSSPCMHEFVLSFEKLKEETGVTSLDIAKALIDSGIHPPTIYFPLIVHEAAMFEPTETESKETLDWAVSILKALYKKAHESPGEFKNMPQKAAVTRPDDVQAARFPKLIYIASSSYNGRRD